MDGTPRNVRYCPKLNKRLEQMIVANITWFAPRYRNEHLNDELVISEIILSCCEVRGGIIDNLHLSLAMERELMSEQSQK